MFTDWWKLPSDLAMANLEAHRVIRLRMAKFSRGGPSAHREARRMLVEKIAASAEASVALGSGRTLYSVLRRYRTLMRANAKRLSKRQ